MTDDELMARAAGGDKDAVRLLVERWEAPIFSFMESMLGSPEEAEDVRHDRDPAGGEPDGILERKEAAEAVGRALASLPERQRQAIHLRHYEDMSQAEIADAMGTTVSAVETLLYRAMQSLRKKLLRGE